MRSYVLDSWAMMAFFENEAAASRVEKILVEAHEREIPLLMSVVNAGELWYNTARAHSSKEAEKVIEELGRLRIELVPADWELSRQAAVFKSGGRIALADCFAAALAGLRKAELVTGDPEFKLLSREIKILWV